MSVEDAVREVVDEQIEHELNSRDLVETSELETAVEDALENQDVLTRNDLDPDDVVTESRLYDFVEKSDLSSEIEEVIANSVDSVSAVDQMVNALEGLPSDEGSRCSDGRAVTDAIRKVLRDDATLAQLRDSLHLNGAGDSVRAVAHDVNTGLQEERADSWHGVTRPVDVSHQSEWPFRGAVHDEPRHSGERRWALILDRGDDSTTFVRVFNTKDEALAHLSRFVGPTRSPGVADGARAWITGIDEWPGRP